MTFVRSTTQWCLLTQAAHWLLICIVLLLLLPPPTKSVYMFFLSIIYKICLYICYFVGLATHFFFVLLLLKGPISTDEIQILVKHYLHKRYSTLCNGINERKSLEPNHVLLQVDRATDQLCLLLACDVAQH